jgi:putative Mn2+ efflux pump MntP
MSHDDDGRKSAPGLSGLIVGLMCIFVCVLMVLIGGPSALLFVTPKGYRHGIPMFLFLVLGIILVVYSLKNKSAKKEKNK